MATNVAITGPVDRTKWTNGTGSNVSSGDLVVRESGTTGCVGLALVDIADTESGQVLTQGVVKNYPAQNDAAWADGDKLYLVSGSLTKTSGGTYAGRAYGAKPLADAVGSLNLNA